MITIFCVLFPFFWWTGRDGEVKSERTRLRRGRRRRRKQRNSNKEKIHSKVIKYNSHHQRGHECQDKVCSDLGGEKKEIQRRLYCWVLWVPFLCVVMMMKRRFHGKMGAQQQQFLPNQPTSGTVNGGSGGSLQRDYNNIGSTAISTNSTSNNSTSSSIGQRSDRELIFLLQKDPTQRSVHVSWILVLPLVYCHLALVNLNSNVTWNNVNWNNFKFLLWNSCATFIRYETSVFCLMSCA